MRRTVANRLATARPGRRLSGAVAHAVACARALGPGALVLACATALAPAALAGQEAGLEACPPGDPDRGQVNLEGVVRDRDSDVPLPGASVTLGYREAEGEATPEDRSARTDRQGRFRLCGLEGFGRATVRATYNLRRGPERDVSLERGERIELDVDLGDSAFLVFSVVEAETGRPVRDATVELSPLPLSGITDSLGRLAFETVPPGDYDLTVRHIAYAPREDAVTVREDQNAEMRLELVTQAIAVEPLEVRITGRDPYLLTSGFYERRETIDGYFGTAQEISTYRTIDMLFEFNRALSVRYRRNRTILINGRTLSQTAIRLNEIPYRDIRGIEAYPCTEAPPRLMLAIPATQRPTGDCNIVAVWVR